MISALLALALTQGSIDDLVAKLSGESVEERERAAAELVRRGSAILAELEGRAAAEANVEIRGRLQDVARAILAPPELRRLLDGLSAGPWSWYGEPRRPRPRPELAVGVGRELLGAPAREKALRQLASPREPGSGPAWKADREAIDVLRRERAAWCLAAGLYHESYLVQLDCARALSELKERKVAPVLLDVARALAIPVEGSKQATVHGFRQHGIAKALDGLLGTSAAWREGQNTDALLKAIEVWRKAIEN